MKKYLWIFICLINMNVFAQSAWTHYSTLTSPLPENSVRCITIDALGRKWIGTDYGLSVFDDVSWTNYFTTNSGLPDNVVRAIAFDSFQNAWIGTFNGGLAKFDGTTWTVYDILNSGLPDNSVKSLAFDSTGALWIGTLNGLAKFDGTSWLLFNQSNSLLMSDNIAAIHPSSNNRVFIGTVNGGLAIVDNDTIKDIYTIANGSGIPDNTQLGFDEDSVGNVWIATPANGIVVFRNVGGWFWYYMGNSFLQSNSLSGIKFNADESAIWLSTLDSGIIKRTGVTYQSFTTVNSPMPDNTVQCITLDSNNVVWIGTASQGVVKFDETLTGLNLFDIATGNIIVYPNPFKDFVEIKSHIEIVGLEIFGAAGRKYFAGRPISSNFKLSTVDFEKGIYFVKLFLKDGNFEVKKLAKN